MDSPHNFEDRLDTLPAWSEEMKRAIRDPAVLCRMLELPPTIRPGRDARLRRFSAVRATALLAAAFNRPDPADPLLRQVLPTDEELRIVPGFQQDPVQDLPSQLHPGVIRKYPGRVLLIASGACAVHCRYCFRRFFSYESGPRSAEAWQEAIGLLLASKTLEEVILSGGDPLTLPDAKLQQLVRQLDVIPSLQRLRIHTRLPILIPQRATSGLLRCLTQSRFECVIVVHVNHPQEIDSSVMSSLRRFARSGCLLLNQAVLLRGINDRFEVLADLSRRLLAAQTVPYYLHQLDRVAGAAHFEVPVSEGIELIREMRRRLPGYAVPRYVRDDPGEKGKTLLA